MASRIETLQDNNWTKVQGRASCRGRYARSSDQGRKKSRVAARACGSRNSQHICTMLVADYGSACTATVLAARQLKALMPNCKQTPKALSLGRYAACSISNDVQSGIIISCALSYRRYLPYSHNRSFASLSSNTEM